MLPRNCSPRRFTLCAWPCTHPGWHRGGRELLFLNMVATFCTALGVTAAEFVIEAFYPADPVTSQALQGLWDRSGGCQ